MIQIRALRAAFAVMTCLVAVEAEGQDCPTTFGATTPQVGEVFGYAVALDDGIALVGNLPSNGTVPGAAYIFDLASGVERLKLVEPGLPTGTYFGWAVALSKKYAVVGAYGPGPDDGPGAAYVFDAATGALLWHLAPSDGADSDYFGGSVAVHGDTAVIGAAHNDDAGSDAGRVYVYDLITGAEKFSFGPTGSRTASDRLGYCVAIDGNTIVAGAFNDDSRGVNANTGAVYVADLATRRVVRKLFASDAAANAQFGYFVAVEGSRIVVGAPRMNTPAIAAGAVYQFDAATGAQTRRITLAEGQAQDSFGYVVAIRGPYLVASAPLFERRKAAGSVYVFDSDSGERLSTLPKGGRDEEDLFGIALALDDRRLIVGAPYDDGRGFNAGEVEVFELDALPDTPIVFDPIPTVTKVKFDITLPGIGSFSFERELAGRIVAEVPLDCDPPKSFSLLSVELRPTTPIEPLSGGPGVSGTFHDPGIRIVPSGEPAVIAPDGTFTQRVRFGGFGTVEYDFLGFKGAGDVSDSYAVPFTMTGRLSDDAGVLRIDSVLPETSGTIDLGLGALNPTYTISGAFSALRSPRRFRPRTPSVTKKAALALDFVRANKDSVTFSGTFERSLAPDLAGGASALLRIGAFHADVALSEKGASAKGAPAAVKLKVKKRFATFKVQVKLADLRASLAALPAEESLPRSVAWTLVLDDDWNIGGELSLNGGDKLTFSSPGVIARAKLRLTK